jgi:hypothetical protein
MIRKQLTLYLENRPGVIAKVAASLAAARINIEGISVAASPDVGLVQIIVNKAAAARKVLTRLKISHTVQEVAMVSVPDKPGALARLAAQIARAGLNINYIYGTACQCKCECGTSLVVSASNLKRLAALSR